MLKYKHITTHKFIGRDKQTETKTMENTFNSATTQIKYKTTSCYFCSEWCDNDNFKAHLDQCGQVLEKCPNKCLAYIQRKNIEQHLLQCPLGSRSHKENGKTVVEPRTANNAEMNEADWEQRCFALEQNVIALRSALHEEIRQRHRLISDVGELRKQNQNSESWIQKVGDVLTALKKCLHDETESRCIDIKNCKEDIDQLIYQYKEIKEWRKELRDLLDQFHRDLEFRNDVTSNLEILFGDNQVTVAKVKSLEQQIDELKLLRGHKLLDSTIYESGSTLDQLASLPSNRVSIEIERAKNSNQRPHIDLSEIKLAKLSLEVKQMKNIVCETEDRCDKLDKIVSNVRKMSTQTNQELRDLEGHWRMQKKMANIVNCDGHLIWRISQYTAKLKEAKENDVKIKSPFFCNKQYGYTLRLDISLNGIGTWKGRNLLACLTVVTGEWDSLLTWPCKLQADIILRDQCSDLTAAKDISKTITVKKRDSTYEHNQYIFISHKTIFSQSYLRNDSIYFEVKVRAV